MHEGSDRGVGGLEEVEEFIALSRVDSTNTYAGNLGRTPREGFIVVRADRQSAGRGRRGNSFFSDVEGGLWATIVTPAVDRGDHFIWNRALVMAVYDSIRSEEPTANLGIKWPNDILWGDRKVCGVLIESLDADNGVSLAMGVGVNVNIPSSIFPPELRNTAGSLMVETGRRWDTDVLLRDTVVGLRRRRREPPESVHREYRARLYGVGREIAVDGVRGTLEDVGEDGRLGVRVGDRVRWIVSGSVAFVDRGSSNRGQ